MTTALRMASHAWLLFRVVALALFCSRACAWWRLRPRAAAMMAAALRAALLGGGPQRRALG